jgi:excisionase family DNA binding protein
LYSIRYAVLGCPAAHIIGKTRIASLRLIAQILCRLATWKFQLNLQGIRMDELLTTKQLMAMLQLDRSTIYRMLSEGRLPAVRVGGQWRFSRQAIDEWIQVQNLPASNEPKETMETCTAATYANAEILPLSCVQPIQQVFALSSEIGAVTTDLDGKPLTTFSNPCAFCNLILATEKGRARCQDSRKKFADQNESSPHFVKCHAGLACARAQIVVQGTPIAMSFIGQFVIDDATSLRGKTHLAQVARACDVEETKLAKTAEQVRVLAGERAERLLNLLELVANTYSHIGEERLELISRLRQVAEIAGASQA